MDDSEELAILGLCEDDKGSKRTALHSFFSEHGLGVFHAIRKDLWGHGIRANLDDMANEVFQQLATELVEAGNSQKLLEVKSLVAYVYGAARRKALNCLRDGARRVERTARSDDFWQAMDGVLVEHGIDPLQSRELEDAVYDCIEELEGKQREYVTILAQDIWDPPKPAEIARMLGVSPESVRNRLTEARRRIKECLERKEHRLPFRTKGSAR